MYILSIDRCEFFLSSLKCNAHALRLPRSSGEFCTFPCGHWIRANIECGHRRVVCLFKQETPEGVRWPLWKRGRNPTTRHRIYSHSQIPSQIHIFVGSTEAPSKVFLLFFLLPDWLKFNHLKSRIECGFSDIFSRHICSTVEETMGVTNNPAGFGAKKCSENHI